MKFSIIIPAYNVEKYIERCLDSIFSNSYKNYEIIIVNDGSTDNVEEKINKYLDKYNNIIYIKQENKGLSEARNEGVKKATGDYLLFVDSDDFIEPELLEKINNSTKNNPDLIRFQAKEVYDDKTINYNESAFENKNGIEAFSYILNFHFVEPACLYAYNLKFYKDNDFKFTKGIYHEDYALVPYIINKANIVNCIDYIGYDYYQRGNSIMNNPDYSKTLKKVDDLYKGFKILIDKSNNISGDRKLYYSYISNIFVKKICSLNKEDYKKYKKILKEEKVYDLLLSNTLSRKIKKMLIKISPKLYYKLIG